MLFNSYEFLFLLLPVTLAGYFLLWPKAWRHGWLALCSFVFYGWWDYRYCGLLLLAISIDYCAGGRIAAAADPAKKKRWLLLSICSDMGMLGFFKYYDLGAGTANALAQALGAETGALPLLHLVLPVGISFYTFQAISYAVDVYRRRFDGDATLLEFMFYLTFFPLLLAGPITRAKNLIPRLRRNEQASSRMVWVGLWLIMLGVVIAVQQIESHVLQPFLLGRAVRVHPLAVILAIATGVIVWGIVGALIAVPVAAVVNAVGHHLLASNSAAPEDVDDVLTPAQRAEVATDEATTTATAAIEAADN